MKRQWLREIASDVGAELRRLGSQGAAETASALFAGTAYVPYGPGQQPAAGAERLKERMNAAYAAQEAQAEHRPEPGPAHEM